MDFKTTFTKRHITAGFTLVEFMTASALGTLVLAVMCLSVLYCSWAFAAITNYSDLDLKSEQTLDKMSREIREADHMTYFASNSITFADNTGATVQYQYDSNAKTLNRIAGGSTNAFLTGCNSLLFSIYQRTPISNTFQPYSTSTYTNAKVIQIDWKCSRNIEAATANTESVESAKIVIRNH
ncbi:MAG: hypothetical protein JWR26_2128 [Pedosphaera sp.]|nr:hypothetical protein [Pedosphaera sp.]